MEIQGQRPDPSRALRQRVEDATLDAAKRSRERMREAVRPDAPDAASGYATERIQAHRAKQHRIEQAESPARPDRIELSNGARAVAAAEDLRAATDPGHLARLRALMADGGLFTPERIEQAARRLLAGE
jgi:hypothetical protein